jgi:hypothetical protein
MLMKGGLAFFEATGKVGAMDIGAMAKTWALSEVDDLKTRTQMSHGGLHWHQKLNRIHRSHQEGIEDTAVGGVIPTSEVRW